MYANRPPVFTDGPNGIFASVLAEPQNAALQLLQHIVLGMGIAEEALDDVHILNLLGCCVVLCLQPDTHGHACLQVNGLHHIGIIVFGGELKHKITSLWGRGYASPFPADAYRLEKDLSPCMLIYINLHGCAVFTSARWVHYSILTCTGEVV